MKNSHTKISFDTIGRDGVDISKALAVITKKLGRGNQSDAIRRAIIAAAEMAQHPDLVRVSLTDKEVK